MDIRGRCDIVYDRYDFMCCPARVDTAWFMFGNDYKWYKELEQYPLRYRSIIKRFLKEYKVFDEKIYKGVCEMYKEERKEENRKSF